MGDGGSPEYILRIDVGLAARFALEAPFERCMQFRGSRGTSYDTMWPETLGAVESELIPCDRPLDARTFADAHNESVDEVLDALGHDVYSSEDREMESGRARQEPAHRRPRAAAAFRR